jgi:hypothetical protein
MDAVYASQSASLDGRSPDTLDAVSFSQSSIVDGRSPDTLDAISADSRLLAAVSNQAKAPLDSSIQAAINNYGGGSLYLDGRSPDTLDAVSSSTVVPLDSSIQSAINNYGSSSPYLDGRSADTLDAVSAAQTSVVDGRSADTRDAAYVAHEPVVTVSVSRFDWADAGIGFGTAFGLALLGFAMFALRHQSRPNAPMGHASAS